MSALWTLRQADKLLRDGRTDDEVERITGATLGEILELRAKIATAERAAARGPDDVFSRRWWSRPQ